MVKIANNTVTEVFQGKSMKNTFNTSCYYNGHIYGVGGRALTCISAADGELQWSERGFGLGSVILVGDNVVALTDKGVLKLVEAAPEAYREKGSFQALTGKSWTAPSFANGTIYLRNLTEISSYQVK